jgi:hypothetical protein
MDSHTDYSCLQSQVRELQAQLAALQKRCDELLKEKNDIFYKWTKEDFTRIISERYGDLSKEFQEKIWKERWNVEFEKRFPFESCYEYMLVIMDDILAEYQ